MSKEADTGPITSQEMYELLVGFASLSDINRKILLCLAHIYPRAVSGVQLTKMIGYSGKAKSLYRGVLDRLAEDKLILRDKLTSRLHSLRINHLHPLARSLIALCRFHGQKLRKLYENMLRTEKNGKNDRTTSK